MKCGVCQKEWTIEYICLDCWDELLNREEELGCLVCGSELMMRVEELSEGSRVLAVMCPTCRVMYKPM